MECCYCGRKDSKIRDLEIKVEALSQVANQYLWFFDACRKDPAYNKTHGASETNYLAVKFRKALDGK